MKFGFCGPTYASLSVKADAQRCINWIPELLESQPGRIALYDRPGLKPFSTLTQMKTTRAGFGFEGRVFSVGEDYSSQYLFELFQNTTNIQRGKLGRFGGRVTMAANNAAQLMITSAGRLFLLDLKTNALSEIDTTTQAKLQGPVAQIGFSDGYFIALLQDGRFQISKLLDGTSWDPLSIAQVSVYPEASLAMIIDHREMYLLGPKAGIWYHNSGDPLFPWEPVSGSYIEHGIAAPASMVKLDNTVLWIGANEHGQGMAWRIQGVNPQRISNHAVEAEWQGYTTIADAEGYAMQWHGHSLWIVFFPTANKTWVYDVSTGMWHEWQHFDGGAHRSRWHVFALGKHLCGDTKTGAIYEMSDSTFEDFGNPLIRIRRSPHTGKITERTFYDRLFIDVESGVGPQPPLRDGAGKPREPQMMLRFSDDGGRVYGNEQTCEFGAAGEFLTRVDFRRLGSSILPRVWELKCSDPVPARIIDAELE